MGCATLTKGPVGILLPCLVTGVFLLIRGISFFKAFWKMVLVGLASCLLPAIWYLAAYQQGGDNFISLVMEENLGRFMGKMSYESHENGVHYYFIMLAAGLLPYTILLLVQLFFLKYSRPTGGIKKLWIRLVNYLRQMDAVRLYSLLSIVVIFVFYCIPKSKRSVYLLPIFPFIAYYLAELLIYLYRQKAKSLKIFSIILCSLGALLTLVFGMVRLGWIPESVFGGKHAAENIAYLHALESMPLGIDSIVLILLPFIVAIYLFVGPLKKKDYRAMTYTLIASVFAIFLALDGVLQPAVLNVKSDKRLAEKVKEYVPEGNLYSYIKVDMMRFFTINFYCGNRVLLFESEKPEEGYLLIGKKDAANYLPQQSSYSFEQVYESDKRSCDTRDNVRLYHFKKK
ncbi:MAG: dolichyl-phosphate-mannose--protein mannosyltransferase, partial [Bacteroidaceae bacterium]|nr:dolichyl-phosphate-mannose--protein mannosyltransferase [Bacteroidaceae bacterium]